MSLFRKILMAVICIVVAAVSTWLRYGDVASVRQCLANRPPSKAEVAVAAPEEESLPYHLAYGGTGTAAHDSVMVLHFRRPDTPDETLAKAAVRVFAMDGSLRKEISVWGAFRHDASMGASIARFAIGTFPPDSYRIEADIGSHQPLSVRRAAIEFASVDSGPVWAELTRAK